MNQSVEEAYRRLANVSSYRHHLDGVERADLVDDRTSHWTLQLPMGFNADFLLLQAVSDETTTMFRSVDGDLEICGVITFTRIKKNLTEVDITLNYESNSILFNAMDRVFRIGDHFLTSQLRRVRAHFEGIAAPVAQTAEYLLPAVLKVATT